MELTRETWRQFWRTQKKNNMEKQVKYLGYIDKKEITALYKSINCSFMPTYFGPTNIPPLEAFKNSVPVLYPIFDSENKLFNNGIWPIDLKDPKTLSLQIEKILKNDGAKDEKKLNLEKSFRIK